MFAPWVVCPGVVANTTRTVPPSPFVAGAISRADSLGGSSNAPAAGINGQALYVTALSAAQLTDSDRETLNTAGVNALIMKYGGVRIYGWRSLANPSTEPEWANWGNARLITEIVALADQIGEGFLFDEIDGQGRTISAFGAALTGILMPFWDIGSLYGATPDQAFVVDVGPNVNTPTTIQNRELRAVIMVRPSPFAEMVTIELVKQLVTDR
jgi:phage tail sheath protein FI